MKQKTIVYVLNKKGKPLMPTTRCGKVHKLLKEGKVTKDKIKLTTNESGDWAILKYKDFKREGHQIREYDWIDLLEYLGYKIEDKEISLPHYTTKCKKCMTRR